MHRIIGRDYELVGVDEFTSAKVRSYQKRFEAEGQNSMRKFFDTAKGDTRQGTSIPSQYFNYFKMTVLNRGDFSLADQVLIMMRSWDYDAWMDRFNSFRASNRHVAGLEKMIKDAPVVNRFEVITPETD